MNDYTRFVILLNTVNGSPATEGLIRAHVAFLRKLDAKGKLVMCGPFTDFKGGMVIVKAANIDDATRIAKRDPFVVEGVRTFEIRTWELSCEENNHMGMG